MRCAFGLLPLTALTAGLVLAGPIAAQPSTSPLTLDGRARLLAASGDERLPRWQRDFMLDLARDIASADSTIPGTTAVAGDGVWQRLGPPNARYLHAAVYDPVRDRMLVFGGYNKQDDLTNDVWALSLGPNPKWTLLAPGGAPPSARQLTSAIYDPVRDRLVVFGGLERSATGYLGDVWALSLAGAPAWSRIVPAGTGPSARARHSAVYDPVRDRMIVFGGYHAGYRGADAGPLNDVWALSLSESPAWTPIVPIGSAPSARYGQSAVYDPIRDRVLVFGGFGQTYFNDVWSLSLRGRPHWLALAASDSLPAPRLEHSAIFDPGNDRMVIFGGSVQGAADGAWSLSLHGKETWTRMSSASEPIARSGHSAIYDPVRARMVVYGGTPDGFGLLGEIWSMSLSGATTWTRLVTPDPPSGTRRSHTAIYDPLRERMLLFGGYDEDSGSFMNDVWALSLAGEPAWTLLHPSGPAPSPRADHGAIYDPVRDRMIVFGGEAVPDITNDVWALSFIGEPAWSQLTPVGAAPAPRTRHSTIYDAANDRMVVYGGVNTTSYLGDAWALSLSTPPTWTRLTPTGTSPGARFEHSAIYDPVRERMVVFGGLNSTYFMNDVWTLSLAGAPAWALVTPMGVPPAARAGHRATYDAARDRMIVFGGFSYSSGAGPGSDTWALSLDNSTWTLLHPAGDPPGARTLYSAIYDVAVDRMLIFGGYHAANELWELGWGMPSSVASVSPPELQGLTVPHVSPNPSRGEVTISFTLAQPAEADIRIYDVSGRTVRTLPVVSAAAGRRTTQWDRRTSTGGLAQPGLYFCELRANGRSATGRFVLVH